VRDFKNWWFYWKNISMKIVNILSAIYTEMFNSLSKQ
jgi:hypothetical protein